MTNVHLIGCNQRVTVEKLDCSRIEGGVKMLRIEIMSDRRARPGFRRRTGSSVAEIAAVISMLFGLVMLPLLDLGCIGLRAHIIQLAARDGAAAGARARDLDEARSKAKHAAIASLQKFTGVKIKKVECRFVQVSVDDTTQQVRFTNPKKCRKGSRNVLQMEVEIAGEVEPLFKLSGAFGDIPGLTADAACSGIARQYLEHPEMVCAIEDDTEVQ